MAGERETRRLGGAAALALALSLAPAARAQEVLTEGSAAQASESAEEAPSEAQDDAALPLEGAAPEQEPLSLGAVYARIAELRNSDLRAALDELWQRDPRTAFEALVLRAGRETPAVLSGPRRTARDALRSEAERWLAERLDADPGERARCVGWLAELVRETKGRDSLSRAAMRLAGDLRLYELSAAIAAHLAADRPEARAAARVALFALYMRWFESPESFEAFREQLRGRSGAGYFLEVSQHYEQLARERQVELIEQDPARASAALDDADPRVRSAAARALSRALAGGRAEEGAVVRRLLGRLGAEEDAAAFHAAVEALVTALAAAPPDGPLVREARLALDGAIRAGHPGHRASVASALGRLPWALDREPQSDCLLRGVEGLRELLDEGIVADELADRDVLIVALRALQTLCGRAREAGLDLGESRSRLRHVALSLLEDERQLEGLRVAAALLLPSLARPEDGARVIAVIERAGERAELALAAALALGEVSRALDESRPEARAALDTLVNMAGSENADLRRRALGILSEEPHAARVARSDPALFVDWLGSETLPELESRLLSLAARHGGPAQLERLLSLANFDALARRGPGRVGELANALSALAGEHATLVFRSAERLVAVEESATEVRRQRVALQLVAGLPLEDARGLAPSEHRAIVRWGQRFRDAGGDVGSITEPGTEFLARLVRVHLAGAEPLPGDEAAADAHVAALFLGDLFALDHGEVHAAEVELHYAQALEHARAKREHLSPARVLRDRARFRSSRGASAEALADYGEVLAMRGEGADGSAICELLELSDLRDAASISTALAQAAGDSGQAVARKAVQFTGLLVGHPSWSSEAHAVRMQDLRELAERLARARDRALLAPILAQFARLPTLPPAEGSEGTTPGVASGGGTLELFGAGLLAERDRLDELHALQVRLETLDRELAAIEAQEEARDEARDEARSAAPASAADRSPEERPAPPGEGSGGGESGGDARR